MHEILFVLSCLLVDDIAGLALFFLWLLIVNFEQFVGDFHLIIRKSMFNICWLIQFSMQSINLLTLLPVIIILPLLTALIIPLLNHVPPIISLALIIEGILILALGLEVGIVYVKVTAFKVVDNLFVRQCILR